MDETTSRKGTFATYNVRFMLYYVGVHLLLHDCVTFSSDFVLTSRSFVASDDMAEKYLKIKTGEVIDSALYQELTRLGFTNPWLTSTKIHKTLEWSS